jgi:hypothetical protein
LEKGKRAEVMATDDDVLLWMEPGTARKRLRVALGQFKGNRYLDLRRYFKDKSDGSYKPSREGITLNKTRLIEIKALLTAKAEEINDWLSVGYVPETVTEEKKKSQAASVAALTNLLRDLVGETKLDPHDDRLFTMATAGSRTTVTYNTKHPFGQELNRVAPEGSDARTLVTALCATYGVASQAIADNEDIRYLVEHEWASQLKSYLKRTRGGHSDDAS